MAKNVFNATLDVNNRVNRNSFDWSHQNNLTLNMGQIVPVMCELVPPASSLKIKPTFGLQFMPMVFPVQTRMRAQLSFYKVPIRTLWKDYTDFVGNFKKNLVPPYLDINSDEKIKNFCTTCSLGDYLGIPTTRVGSFGSGQPIPIKDAKLPQPAFRGSPMTWPNMLDVLSKNNPRLDAIISTANPTSTSTINVGYSLPFTSIANPTAVGFTITFGVEKSDYDGDPDEFYTYILNQSYLMLGTGTTVYSDCLKIPFSHPDCKYEILENQSSYQIRMTAEFKSIDEGVNISHATILFTSSPENYGSLRGLSESGIVDASIRAAFGNVVSELTLATSPYYNSSSPLRENQLQLSAYPPRAYEAIYNAYYRDNRNNPYVLNGEIEYNRWIPTDEGGADTTDYKLRMKNWEQDFLTTAVQSPQQGPAPLVGLTTYTSVDGASGISLTDENGKSYSVKFESDDLGLNDVSYEELNPAKNSVVQPRSLYDLATSGISIADFRNVNAYQRYLEMNMRKGYSYRDVIEGHFDTKVSYDSLLMPEYIGGLTQQVDMNSVVQSVETTDSGSYAGSLGSMAGSASVRGEGNNDITVYCDEESYIIGLLSVVPVPNYSQLLPKHWLHRDLLDSFYPEFDNIGFQPITYKEVCPIQSFADRPSSLNDTFGYNRAWYDYVSKVDTVHGLFRTNMRNFLINRTFNLRPELSESFLLVDEKQVNEVFSVTESTDKIFGQVFFECHAQLPISRVNIPKLE